MEINFKKLDLTEEEFNSELQATSKFLGVGKNIEVKIVHAEYKKMNDNDNTWANYTFMLSKTGTKTSIINGKTKAIDDAGKECPSMFKFLMIPTQRIRYEKFGISRAGALFPFTNFKNFCAGIGEKVECSDESLTRIYNTWFKDPTELIGQSMIVDIGYNKIHVAMQESVFVVLDVKGEKVLAEDFVSRDDAIAAAATAGLPALQTWPEITKIHPRS
jgi:hypothetical protein